MKKSPSFSLWSLIAGCVLALTLGIFLGSRLTEPSAVAPPVERILAANSDKPEVAAGPSVSSEPEGKTPGTQTDAFSEAAPQLNSQIAELNAFLERGRIDPIASVEEALAMSNDLERTAHLALMLAQAEPEDMLEIADLISGQSNGFEQMRQMGMVYYAWGRTDAPSAVAFAETQGGRRSGMGVGIALSSWASLDPSAARGWVDASENPDRYRQGLLVGWSETDPAGALRYMSAQASGDLMNRWTAPQFVRNLIDARGVFALDDISAMPASGNRNELLERLAGELTENDLLAATQRLTTITDPAVLRAAVPEFAQEMARNNPTAALEFMANYADNPEIYARGMAEAIEEWAERDPYEAGRYLNDQPASPVLDRAVAEYSREAARVDPEGAMSFAISVNDDEMRSDTIRRVARDWSRSAPEDYAIWAADNPEIAPAAEELEGRDRRWR